MKRLLSISFIALALFVGAASTFPSATHAQPVESALDAEDQALGQAMQAAAQTPTPYKGSDSTDSSYNWIMIKIMQLFAWLAGVAMITLNYSIYYTVVTMGTFINDLSAVGVTWSILRDIGNILLIFGFLAAGIAIILNTDLYGWGKKMLPMLLVAAVFLNFSLFIAEAVIDTGNLFATQFYRQINNGDMPTPATLSNEGISDKIMSTLGLQTIYGQVNQTDKAQQIFQGGNPWIIGFMSILLFIILAFVLFSLAFVLIARFVILLFLIIIAPIGFAGLAVPKLEVMAKKWWASLFEQTITAPILLLLLYVALAVITDARFLTGFGSGPGADWLGTIRNNIVGFAPVFLSFLVAMGLLLAVVIASKKLSAFGAGWATRTAGALSFGATAWAGRNTGGWIANKTARGLRKTRFARVPLVGTGIIRGLDRAATGSFDVRGVKLGGGLKAAGVEAGDAQKGGYRAELKSRVESRTKYASELKGRELTEQQKIDAAKLSAEIKNDLKAIQRLRVRGASVDEVKAAEGALKRKEADLEKIESVTDRGAQRKYAKVLELGLNSKGTFNTYFNFASNTEAARKIRDEAKKTKSDKDWTESVKKALKEAAGEEESGAGAGATTSPAGAAPGGGGGAAPAGGGPGGTSAP